MAAGLPPVAPNQGSVLSFANQPTAWLANPTGEDFARAVREVFAHPQSRASCCDLARKTAESLCWDRVTAEYFALYDKLHGRFRQWQLGQDISERPETGDSSRAAVGGTQIGRAARLAYAWNDVFRPAASS
jgi:hypothetical protein